MVIFSFDGGDHPLRLIIGLRDPVSICGVARGVVITPGVNAKVSRSAEASSCIALKLRPSTPMRIILIYHWFRSREEAFLPSLFLQHLPISLIAPDVPATVRYRTMSSRKAA
ncbi:hypothetical protein QA644_30270 (plasmid) [Rhizobium sp. CC1099]|uniref:hypothetical protein n=1 Tax=Rhizobium sp. CC1099 TaxID=3039160 RepID=UPI0024B19AE1|nr:hypothetical protein [Rhizobium sp. CC1099]WFU90275.1 hypothetical protein QA644_30270 [Rhizobium sp. CC1099]